MKKSLLLFVSLMLATMSALAQWVDPVPTATEPSTDNTPQFLWNIGAKGFFGGGNDYNTRASISHTFGDSIYFQAVEGAEGSYYFRCFPSVAKKGFFFFVSANNWDASWVDAPNNGQWNETLAESDKYPGVDKWALSKQTNGNYKIYNTTQMVEVPDLDPLVSEHQGYYGIAQIFWGGNPDTDTRVWFYDDNRQYKTADPDTGEEIDKPAFEGEFYDEWYFVSQEDYADWKLNKEIYEAAVALGKAIDETKELYDGIDLSKAEAIYNNYSSIVIELDSARTKLIPEAITAFVDGQIDNATLDNPVNVTSRIGYIEDLNAIAAGNGKVPSNGWVSTKVEGNFHINTWSTEGNTDGTNMTTPFVEYWKGAGNILDNQKFYRDPAKDPFDENIPAGAYKVTSNIRIFNEATGATFVKGGYLFGNLNRTPLTQEGVEGPENAIDGAKYGDLNGKLWYWKDSFEAYVIVPEDNALSFGVQTQDVNFNWVASKDWKVYYLGAAFDAIDFVRQNTQLIADSYGEETIAQKQLVGDYNAAVENYKTASSTEAVFAAYKTISELADSVEGNVAAYTTYKDSLAYIESYMAEEGATLEGETVDLLSDYIVEEPIEPCEEYPNGNGAYILANLSLTTPQIKEEIKFMNFLLSEAISKGMGDGTDLTNLIVNPGFEQAGGVGWSTDTHGGECVSAPTSWHGGSAANWCAEAFQQKFDVYQVIEGVPNGLYEVSVQAFYRTGDNATAYDAYESDPEMVGPAKVLSYVYFNDFASPVKNVMEIRFDSNLANNCYTIPGSDPAEYTLNGMASASEAFSLPDEEKNFTQKVYGLVTDGKIRLGIRNLEKNDGSSWTLWDNFKLKYRAKNEEALNSVLESTIEQYETFVANNADDINSIEQDIASDAIDEAKTMIGETPDAMYDALVALNAAFNGTREHVTAMVALKDAVTNLENAFNEYAETASDEAIEAASILLEDGGHATEDYYDNITTAEIKEVTAEINETIEDLRIPRADASDDEPQDFTSMIVNADIEQGATVGWKYTKNGGNGPGLDSGISGKSMEFWIADASNLEFNIWQEIRKLPAGKYELKADASNSLNGVADPGTAGRAFLYVATYTAESDSVWFSSNPVEPQIEGCTEKYNNYSVIFTINEGENATIGFKSVGTMAARWFVADNFTLTYYGTESAKSDSENPMSVEGLEAAEGVQVVAIYTVAGAPINALQQGLNIVKFADGSVKKVFIK